MLKQGTPVTIEREVFEIGVNVTINRILWRVCNTRPLNQTIQFAKVLRSGELAKCSPETSRSFEVDSIAKFMRDDLIVVKGMAWEHYE